MLDDQPCHTFWAGEGLIVAHDNCSQYFMYAAPNIHPYVYCTAHLAAKGQECNTTKARLHAAWQLYANQRVIFSGDSFRAALVIGLALPMALTAWSFSC